MPTLQDFKTEEEYLNYRARCRSYNVKYQKRKRSGKPIKTYNYNNNNDNDNKIKRRTIISVNKVKVKVKESSIRIRLVRMLGEICKNPKCLIPGRCRDIKCLHIDHINGGGNKDRKKFKSSNRMYKYYLANPDEAEKHLQILCANCNCLKVHSNGENKRF